MLYLVLTLVNSALAPKFQSLTKQDPYDEGGWFIRSYSDTIGIGGKYINSFLNLTRVVFIGGNSFGTTDSENTGGTMYLVSSKLYFDSNNITKATAMNGGALGIMSSEVIIQNSTFNKNKAYINGGDLYSLGESKNPVSWIMIKKTNFTGPTAYMLGGSSCIMLQSDVYIEECLFRNATSGHSAGALLITHSEVKLFKTNITNTVVSEQRKLLSFYEDKKVFPNIINNNFRGPLVRGGGSIVFVSTAANRARLVTQQCNFLSNNVRYDSHMPFLNGKQQYGIDVTLIGHVEYMSIEDNFSSDGSYFFDSYLTQFSIGCKDVNITDQARKETRYTPIFQCHNSRAINADQVYFTAISPNYFKPSGTEVIRFQQTEFPNPTSFVYAATPVTHLPFATTLSHLFDQKTPETMERIKTLSVMATLTPSASPGYTPFPTNSPKASRSFSPSDSPTASPTWDIRYPTQTPHPTPMASASADPTASRSATGLPTPTRSPFPTLIAPPSLPEISQLPDWTAPGSSSGTVDSSGEAHGSNDAQVGNSSSGDGAYSATIYIVIGSVVALAVVIVVAVFLICFLVRRKPEENDDELEEIVETVHFPETQTASITQDNPLWTTSVIGADDDPFKNEFEEEHNDNLFFKIKRPGFD